ncbi:hypothetical protein ABZS66_61795, partial [Dactylosporangium sp. NPDC005572]|uniref:hypothetical protein n=1 Tax=Dactylosporangium sp. NPDC005572 TaxID=3156889 RepID=UPI0033A64053
GDGAVHLVADGLVGRLQISAGRRLARVLAPEGPLLGRTGGREVVAEMISNGASTDLPIAALRALKAAPQRSAPHGGGNQIRQSSDVFV